jgi:drug/metabolite transporter (DMT)-like permease
LKFIFQWGRIMRFPVGALLWVGIGVIVVGIVLMFTHQAHEVQFQQSLLKEFHSDYHWRSVGDTYAGISAIAAGALMMVVAALAPR